jgi:hypothetical protein
VRLPRVVAGASLIVALVLVAVPGTVGSRNPSADLPIDASLLQAVEAPRPSDGTAVPTPTLDPAYRSRGTLDTREPVLEPAVALEAPVRAAVDHPEAPVGFVAIATPTPRPTVAPTPAPTARLVVNEAAARPPAPAPADTPAPAPVADAPSGGGGWNYDPDVSWYGPGLYGNSTGCGQTYTSSILGVAHKTLPCGTAVTFRNPANGAVVTVPVIDRGPYVAGRQWDLSAATCQALGHCYTGPIEWRFP